MIYKKNIQKNPMYYFNGLDEIDKSFLIDKLRKKYNLETVEMKPVLEQLNPLIQRDKRSKKVYVIDVYKKQIEEKINKRNCKVKRKTNN